MVDDHPWSLGGSWLSLEESSITLAESPSVILASQLRLLASWLCY